MSRTTTGLATHDPWIQVFQSECAKECFDGKSLRVPIREPRIPSALLIPRLSKEVHRLDTGAVIHPRGSGLDWPAESKVDILGGSGRMPTGLVAGFIDADMQWRWRESETQASGAAEALGECVSDTLSQEQRRSEVVVSIPNHWGNSRQQQIIDAFSRSGLRPKLLWRPVAAAFEWAQHPNSLDVIEQVKADGAGKLLSIYIGYDALEITELELACVTDSNGSKHVLPARNRPEKGDRFASFGYKRALGQMKGDSSFGSLDNESNPQLGEIWNKFWCTDYIWNSQKSKVESGVDFDDATEDFVLRIEQSSVGQVRDWLQKQKCDLDNTYSGIVISGSYGQAIFDHDIQVWEWVIDELAVRSGHTLIEGVDVPLGMLARGASWFGHKLASDEPTYLDTLPKMQMVISENGLPRWIDLLEPEDKWVDGGKLWERPDRILNLAIAAGSEELKIAVYHEEFEYVREVVTTLPLVSEVSEDVSLSVSVFPAQGKARVEIHPETEDLFEGDRIFLDWRRMSNFQDDSGGFVNRDGYISNLPRVFPDLLPKVQSPSRWLTVQPMLLRLMNMFNSNASVSAVDAYMASTRTCLREKDQRLYPQDATAFDSDGRCAGIFNVAQFMESAWPYFLGRKPKEFVRAAAYMHVDHDGFSQYLLSELDARYIDPDVVVASGKCFRDSQHVAKFIRVALNVQQIQGINIVWWRAISETLRFRSDATRSLDSYECEWLITLAIEVFESEHRRRNGREHFRLACLVIVYLLRRRAFDDDFLDPEGDLATRIKKEFRDARENARSGSLQLMGGSIDLSQQLQLIIDYIDRRGRGQLLIGT